MPIITIDGNIGSGKTSVLNYLHKFYKVSVDLEPVESWSQYLTKMYNEKLDVFKFQVRVWLDRCWIQEKSDKTIILMERSPYFIKNVFIKTATDIGMITEDEQKILIDLHKKTDKLLVTNTMIYLRSSPENCLKKIKKRNRPTEKNISLDYIEVLHENHEKTYINACGNCENIICIDTDGKSVSDIGNCILLFLQETYPYVKYI
jgi:deoxynucleoside kinase